MDASSEPKCRYDIFLSFGGEDDEETHTFTGSICYALRQNGLNPYMDDKRLDLGDQLSDSLCEAIEESRISIIVLCKSYAASPWCLDELVKILETMKMKNQLVWPILYKVEPSHVRYQEKENDFGKAFAELEQQFEKDPEKMNKWRSALSEVANLKGRTFKTGYDEYKFIQEILEKAIAVLHCEQLDVGEHVIGHQSRIEEVKSLLDIESCDMVCMVGIHGTDGIGKTTLAKALYNLIIISHQFECAIFLESVRERSNSYMGLVHLQETLLYKLSKRENIKLGNVDEGVTKLKSRLHYRRVLLVLDDVDNKDQLKKLAGECSWFGSGSRIIITTKDKHLLIGQGIEKIYEMKQLDDHEALQLFCWNAFKMSQPASNFEDISNRAIRYANGLPLVLKVVGSNLFGKTVLQCESALEQYERIPHGKIMV